VAGRRESPARRGAPPRPGDHPRGRPARDESIKWKTPTFAFKGNIASFNPSKRLISILFHRGAEIPGDHPRLEGDGRLARTMRFSDLEDVEAGRAELEAVIRAWCDWKGA
jgi:hypothetical protein